MGEENISFKYSSKDPLLRWLQCKCAFLGFFLLLGSAESDPYFGTYVGKISNKEEGISGKVYCVDKNTIFIQNFTYTGKNSPLFVYAGTLGKDGGYTKTGYPLKNIKGRVRQLTPNDSGSDVTLSFPEGKSLYQVDWLGVISRKKKALYSRVLVDQVKERVPRPHTLSQVLKGKNGLSSTEVVILDSRTVMVKDLKFKGVAPDTHFYMGSGNTIDGRSGFPIPDEMGSYKPLGRYSNKTILLAIPEDKPDIFSNKWLSIWSEGLQVSLASVDIPAEANVPPALEKLGVDPQTTLNCELLDLNFGLELRWTLASSESDDEPGGIILQLVSRTASDRYLAFGIRQPKDTQSNVVSGDVIVGWINDDTGKGSVDDYFLANPEAGNKCNDDAESCPDQSKPGGANHIELLNAVSRDNYTMLTFRRPLEAKDPYDVRIDTAPGGEGQPTFWSVGYKSAKMRQKHKPVKNSSPHLINFGRRARWNCPKEEEEEVDELDDIEELPTPPTVVPATATRPSFRRPLPRQKARFPRPSRPIKGRPRSSSGKGQKSELLSTDWLSPPNTPTPQSGFTPQANFSGYDPRLRPLPDDHVPRRRMDFVGTGAGKRNGGDSEWAVPPISCQEAGTQRKPLYVQLGPAAFHRGNHAVGPKGEGRAFYVNGLLTPDIYMVRGQKYTFMIETGAGDGEMDNFHPVYITADPTGGGHQLKPELQAKMEKIYGGTGLDRDGFPVPTAIGRLCLWWNDRPAATFASYSDFQKSLGLDCQDYESEDVSAQGLMSAMKGGRRVMPGAPKKLSRKRRPPGILQFTPTKDMPDTLYYQSFVARHLGGVIHLVDKCPAPDETTPQSNHHSSLPTFRPALSHHLSSTAVDTSTHSSTKQRTRMRIDPPRRRRIDYDVNDYEYIDEEDDASINAFADEMLARCRQMAREKERRLDAMTPMVPLPSEKVNSVPPPVSTSIKDNANKDGMPIFEHFPLRTISKRSAFEVSEADCKQFITKMKKEGNGRSKHKRIKHYPNTKSHLNRLKEMAGDIDQSTLNRRGSNQNKNQLRYGLENMDPSQFMTDFLEKTGEQASNKPRMSLPPRGSEDSSPYPPITRRKHQGPDRPKPNKRPLPSRPPQGTTNPLMKLKEFFSPAKWFGGGSDNGPRAQQHQQQISRRDGHPDLPARPPLPKTRRRPSRPRFKKRPIDTSQYRSFFKPPALTMAQPQEKEVQQKNEASRAKDLDLLRTLLKLQEKSATTSTPASDIVQVQGYPTGVLADVSKPAYPGQTATTIGVVDIPTGSKDMMMAQDSVRAFNQPQQLRPITPIIPLTDINSKGKQTYGQGFDPNGVKPETGFKPITDKGSSMPTLAFSVYDAKKSKLEQNQPSDDKLFRNIETQVTSESRSPQSYSGSSRENARIDHGSGFPNLIDINKEASGDRGHVLVDVPAPVVPYVPPVTHANRHHQRVQGVQLPEKKMSPTPKPKSADFASFETASHQESKIDVTPVTEYHETDRIDVPSLLPNSKRSYGDATTATRVVEDTEYTQYDDGELEYYYDDEYDDYYDDEQLPSGGTLSQDDVVPALVKLWQETQ